ncbi:uncharacterized protein BBA_09442 [Beauveria bassiana ARSEF 2860]|uniref:Uncharacterized protein n=1 Tax=Beauveria bassiana (strain ARSEF 2860) TaxID=655819 RepID=J4KL52_BEAB2|nr:uncharacterized protein BBA_09442 [Beauveria bassiana ARSEF 2860]EJP61599.1 hypothetical protein BBA_09442 [Beauveria bassiana ARSEF 2860]
MERRPESINADLEEHSVSTLPLSQRAEMWDIAKDDPWRKNAVKRQEEFAQHSQRWSHDRSSIITHMRGTEAEIRDLGKKEEKLSRELAAVRSRAVLVNETYNQEAQRLNNIDAQHNDLMLRQCRNQDGVHERQLALSKFIEKRPAESQLKLPSLTNIPARIPPALEPPRSRSHPITPGQRLDPSPSSTAAGLKALPTAAQEASVKAYTSPYRPLQAHMSGNSSPITKDTLILRHDGSVYTYPKCIEGVPVEKITPSHPYWEPTWPDLRTLVERDLRVHEMNRSAKKAGIRDEVVRTYHYDHKVTQGKRILKFLEQDKTSPYQLLSKRFIGVGHGTITNYNTLYRLCETLESLADYKTDVKPVDWLRQRLHELAEGQGTSFNLAKTIRDFYNDPKLAALRQKAGFKTFGRPKSQRPRQCRSFGAAQESQPVRHAKPTSQADRR